MLLLLLRLLPPLHDSATAPARFFCLLQVVEVEELAPVGQVLLVK